MASSLNDLIVQANVLSSSASKYNIALYMRTDLIASGVNSRSAHQLVMPPIILYRAL